jgi:hypothetical protein
MRQLRLIGMLIALVSFWFAAVGTAIAEDFPKGTFSIKGPDGATWALTFDGMGKVVVTADGKEAVEATYKATGDQVEFTDVKGPRANPGAGPGTYKWKLDGDKLTFTKVKDGNDGRAGALTSGAWVKTEKKE